MAAMLFIGTAANFLNNEQAKDILSDRAHGAELQAAIEVNEEARLQAPKFHSSAWQP